MGQLRIVSQSSEAFGSRPEAGWMLSEELKCFKGKNTVVLGILRGGIIVAREIAIRLDARLDIVLSRKIGAPINPELAVGAVSENGELFVNKETALYTGADAMYIQQEKKRQMAEIKRRTTLFRSIQPKVPLKAKVVIVTDDGVATGATMQAALWAVRQEQPIKLIAAIPVGPQENVKRFTQDADEVVCLKAPFSFSSVGQFYLGFEQVEDKQVIEILKSYKEKMI